MDMDIPTPGRYTRDSALFREQLGAMLIEDYLSVEPCLQSAVQNESMQLVVLTNANSFSASIHLAMWVQDGRLGTIIGQPGGDAPTHYGHITVVDLPRSQLNVIISTTKWSRPDINADQDTLMPDILVPFGTDALEVALEYLADRG
jgi:C-terminal processing protease CtpA/Prc